MATSQEFLNYLLEQFRGIRDITYKRMMGEYLLYYRGKLIGDICDNRVLIKPVEAVKKLLPEAEMQPPYPGAKDMLVLDELENTELISHLFEVLYTELPEPKAKKKKL